MTTKGADIYSVFWEPVDGHANKHKCKRCGIQRSQRVKSGYSNLKDHLNAEHPDWPDIMKTFYAEGRGPIDTWVIYNLIQEIWNEHGDQPDVVIHE